MNDTVTPAKEASFTVGEIIKPKNLEASFVVQSVGTNGMVIRNTSHKKIVPSKKDSLIVLFKGVRFKVVGWDGNRIFTIHTTNE